MILAYKPYCCDPLQAVLLQETNLEVGLEDGKWRRAVREKGMKRPWRQQGPNEGKEEEVMEKEEGEEGGEGCMVALKGGRVQDIGQPRKKQELPSFSEQMFRCSYFHPLDQLPPRLWPTGARWP